jgi:endoglucanase
MSGTLKRLITIFSLTGAIAAAAQTQIKLNQIGFYPDAQKIAIAVGATSDSFSVVAASTGAAVFSGVLGAAKSWTASGEQARIADFSSLTTPGEFKVKAAGCAESQPFKVDAKVHLDLVRGSIKSFYYNRCSFELTKDFAGVYARSAGHPDTAALIHNSAQSTSRPSGTKVRSPGGWYDAGDYGKYIVNSGISTYTMFAAYEAFPAFFDTLKLNIPESANNLPDLLDEALYNLRWMLTMQDPADGGVYHKLTTANFSGMVMPDKDKAARYIVSKSTPATYDFAAVCAQASRIFRKFNDRLPGFADTLLAASLGAWQWGRANPAVYYKNANTTGPAVSTGEYGDANASDERLWAAAELYIATQQDSFFTVAFPDGQLTGVSKIPGWPNVATLGLYSMFLCKQTLAKVSADKIAAAIIANGDTTFQNLANNAYHLALRNNDFGWGSNSVVANRGMALILAAMASQKADYRNAALDNLDYLLGRNPTGYSYVTGYGDKTPMFIHHRPSEADTVVAPIPGFLAGGPNPAMQDTSECGDIYPSKLPACAYLDSVCSYASNEIAINWNAPLVFLAGAIEALYGSGGTGVKPLPGTMPNGKKKAPVIRQGQGRLDIRIPSGEATEVTVSDLHGRVLSRQSGMSSVAVAAAWPMQLVFVTMRTAGDHEAVTQTAVAGIR